MRLVRVNLRRKAQWFQTHLLWGMDVEDVYQEMQLEAWHAWRTWQPGDQYTVTSRVMQAAKSRGFDLLTHSRAQKRTGRTVSLEACAHPGTDVDAYGDVYLSRQLQRAVKGLPGRFTPILKKYYAEGESFQEVANAQGVSKAYMCRLNEEMCARLKEKLTYPVRK